MGTTWQKEVDRVKEWDVFNAKGNGIYAAFKLKVLNSRVKFERMVIEYDNGRKQSVDLNKEIHLFIFYITTYGGTLIWPNGMPNNH